MTPAQSRKLDDILDLWHRWQLGDKGVRGYSSKDPLIGDIRAYRVQYEGQLEAQDEAQDKKTCRDVDFQIRQMEEPYRSAIYADARNLHTGVAVWRSPRLPINVEIRQAIVAEAREICCARLISAGIL